MANIIIGMNAGIGVGVVMPNSWPNQPPWAA
jgi:hypothetical protein